MKNLLSNTVLAALAFTIAFLGMLAINKFAPSKCSHAPTATMQMTMMPESAACQVNTRMMLEVDQLVLELIQTDEGGRSKELKARIRCAITVVGEHISGCPSCQALWGLEDDDTLHSVLDSDMHDLDPHSGM